MGFCQKNGHRLRFSLLAAKKWWIFVRFADGSRKKRVEIETGLPGEPPIMIDCGTHPDGHALFREHDASGIEPEVRVIEGACECHEPGPANMPVTSGVNLVEDESGSIKFSSWKFQLTGAVDSVSITVIIENNITTDP